MNLINDIINPSEYFKEIKENYCLIEKNLNTILDNLNRMIMFKTIFLFIFIYNSESE